MSAPPPVSILLPTHNRADTLRLALRSISAQSFADFEVLVVGDGCTDDSAEVVGSCGDERVRWFDLPKAKGFGYANRNVALREASGALNAYLAHDDLWLPDHLERLMARLEEPAVRFAYSRPLWVMPEGHIVPGVFNLREPATLERFLRHKHSALPAANVAYRDDPEQRAFLWDGDIEQQGDWELWRRVIGDGGAASIAYEPAPTVLRFKAAWRTRELTGPAELDSWAELFAAEGVLPDELRIAPEGEGELQQSAALRAMEAGGSAWASRLQTAAAEAIDTFASFGGNDLSPLYAQLERAETRGERLRAEADRKRERIERLLEKIERLRNA